MGGQRVSSFSEMEDTAEWVSESAVVIGDCTVLFRENGLVWRAVPTACGQMQLIALK